MPSYRYSTSYITCPHLSFNGLPWQYFMVLNARFYALDKSLDDNVHQLNSTVVQSDTYGNQSYGISLNLYTSIILMP